MCTGWCGRCDTHLCCWTWRCLCAWCQPGPAAAAAGASALGWWWWPCPAAHGSGTQAGMLHPLLPTLRSSRWRPGPARWPPATEAHSAAQLSFCNTQVSWVQLPLIWYCGFNDVAHNILTAHGDLSILCLCCYPSCVLYKITDEMPYSKIFYQHYYQHSRSLLSLS